MLRLASSPALFCAALSTAAALLAGSAFAQTSFSAHTLYTSSSSDIVTVEGHGDFNGDGREDLVASDVSNGSAQNGLLFLSTGDGTYGAPVRLPQPDSSGKFAIGDFNQDGKLDFVASGSSGTQMNVYLGNGDGTFQPARTTSDGTTDVLTWLVAADMNHDNKTDIVEAMTTQGGPEILQVWISKGDGTFTAGQRITSGVIATDFGVVTGDFDGDGKPDIAITHTFGPDGPTTIQVWYGDGAGNLGSPYQVSDPNGYEDYTAPDAVADINNDGKSDLVTSRFQSGPSGTSTYLPQIELIEGNANRTLTFVTVPTSNCPVGVNAADYNGDGYNDLAFGEAPCGSVLTGPFTYVVRPGSSAGTFGAEQTIYTAPYDSGSDMQTLKSSQGSKPDLVLTQSGSSTANAGPTSIQLLSNTSSGSSFPSCNTANLVEGINLCKPSGTSATSPVAFSIATAGPTPMRTAAVWIDGVKQYEQFAHAFSRYSFLDKSFTLSNGTHSVTLFGTGWDNTLQKRTFSLTVGSSSGGSCAAPSSAGVHVCSPANGSTVGSPTQVTAAANLPGTLARMEVWVDGYKRYTETTSTQLSTALNLAVGYHRFDIYAVNTAGSKYASTVYATVSSSSCPADPGYDVHICAPISGSTVSSPVQVSATAHITGTFARMEVWVDGVKKFTETSSLTVNTAIPVPSGKNHRFDVYAVNTAGQKWESSVFATVP